ncbi:hypothetical protein [Nitrospira sp. KM1]|nr:hypothetical protein [Nitrospira sp. KM1]
MTQAQVMAAMAVIGKSIPDLKSIEHTGKGSAPRNHRAEIEFV